MLAPTRADALRSRAKLEQLDLPPIRISPLLHPSKGLRVVRLAVGTAVDDTVLARGVFDLLRAGMNGDEDTDVEVDREGQEGLDVPPVSCGRGGEGTEDKAECLRGGQPAS